MKSTAVILDLLRTYGHRGTSVKTIMATGAMFDFSDNLMRVSLSRLVTRGKVENISRGHYRLTDLADPLSEFVERWRLGEDRSRPWDGHSWLLLHTSEPDLDDRDWALDALGFREVTAGLWSRPDNLSLDAGELERLLLRLGMDGDSVLVSAAQLSERWQQAWQRQFDVQALAQTYTACRTRLLESLDRLAGKSREDAMRETFLIGGEAVHILAKDPLLPGQMMDPAPRRALWQTMLDYDRKGREIWAGNGKPSPRIMPTPQLQLSHS